MKRLFLILIIALVFSCQASSQSLRKCGCQTWRQWNSSIPKLEGESRWKRKQNYERYKHQCIIDCRQQRMRKNR